MKSVFTVSFIVSLICCSCMNNNVCRPYGSHAISKTLFLEKYKTFDAGVWGELIDCYLTDSLSFRAKVGSFDEHEFFFASLNGDFVDAYNVESSRIPDTVENKSFSKADIFKNKFSNLSSLGAKPLFGKNTIRCDDNFYDASSYKTDDGYYMSQVQYKCENEFLNAVYYTDSSKFRVFIGIYSPGSLSNNYSVKLGSDSNFYFYNIDENKVKVDTLKHVRYLLSDLHKNGLINVCH